MMEKSQRGRIQGTRFFDTEELKRSPTFPVDQDPKCSVTEVMFLELMGAGY